MTHIKKDLKVFLLGPNINYFQIKLEFSALLFLFEIYLMQINML